MKVTVINKENLSAFSSMIYDEEKTRIEKGLPVIAIGVVEEPAVGEEEEIAIGVLTGHLDDDDAFLLTNIFVVPDSRRMGAGTMLLNALLDVLQSGISVEVEVFAESVEEPRAFETESVEETPEDALKAFLLARGFVSYTPDSSLYAMSFMDAILALEPRVEKLGQKARSFSQYLPTEVKAAGLLALHEGLPVPAGGFPSKGIDEELSSLIYEDGKLGGYLIIDRFQNNHLTISGMYTDGKPKNIGMLFANTLYRAEHCLDEEEIIMVPVISSRGEKLLKRVFPMARKVSENFCLYR